MIERIMAKAERGARKVAYDLVARKLRIRPLLELQKIGSTYGGWIVPTSLITSDWVCYCGGVGEDATFDLGLAQRFGCSVYAFDPTPRAIAYAKAQEEKEARFHFHPYGLWSSDKTLRFFAPRDPAHVSHSVVNLQETDTFFEASCRSIPSVMAELGHKRLDLLKIDVEGAEHEVVRSMLSLGVAPRVICLEVDQPVSPGKFLVTIWRILRARYELVALDGWNFTFVRRGANDGLGS
jgi:FkbM family methyltransferase